MPTTERDAQALTYLAKRLREETYGAGTWDEAGIWATVSKLVGRNLAVTIEQVTRHAADPEAKTPGAINRPFVPEAPKGTRLHPPRLADQCRRHPGKWADNCGGCAADRRALEYDDEGPAPEGRPSLELVRQAHLQAVADLCRHHVSPTHCRECGQEVATGE